MSTKKRPVECCCIPILPNSLPSGSRDQLVAAFKALGDPTRLEIFRLIAAQDEPLCACDVVDRFEVSQPTVSHHLKVLRDAGLIIVSRRGVWAYYAVDPQGVGSVSRMLMNSVPVLESAA